MIIIITGAPGAGKTFLLENLMNLKEYNFVPLKKYTTRYPRFFEKNKEPIDLRYGCDEKLIKNLEYNYEAKGKSYGIDKNEIVDLITHNKIPVVIIRSFEIIKRIKSDFENVRVFFIVGATGETLRKRLLRQGRSHKEISVSDFNFKVMTKDYIDNISVIDRCIINSLYDPELYLEQFIKFIHN